MNVGRAQRSATEAKLHSFKAWVQEQDKIAPGKLHKVVKEKQAVVNEVRHENNNSAEPKEYIDAKRDFGSGHGPQIQEYLKKYSDSSTRQGGDPRSAF